MVSEATAAPARPAATVVVLRDAPTGPEVLLLRRAERGDHNSGAWVFPGGLVDAGDHEAAAHADGLDTIAADERLGSPGAIAFYVAAVRECFEEAGLLFARRAMDRVTDPAALITPQGDEAQRLADWRAPLARGERTLAALCHAEGLRLALDRLVYLSHWVTPLGRPKRFDTRFFVARAPHGQTALHDDGELVEQLWLRPADALARSATLKLMTPTQKTLEAIAAFADVDAVLAWAAALKAVPLIQPNVGRGREGMRPVMPDEPAWAELGRIDPRGHGHGCYDIVPGEAVRLSQRVIRVTANNGSMMTGPGTNAYLVGGGALNHWALIDPGPADESHCEALLAAAPGPIRWILATHTHLDHSPGALALQARTGAQVIGRRPAHPQWQDGTFAPDHQPADGEHLALDGATLRVHHTPGHASNHLCYELLEEKTLFTGDHVMQLSTVVINPPDGDMGAYLASLQALRELDLDWLAPGHGFLIGEPRRAFDKIVAHRRAREAKVLATLRRLGPAPLDALLPAVYDDVPVQRHAMARRSLLAHLLLLRDTAQVLQGAGVDDAADDARWRVV